MPNVTHGLLVRLPVVHGKGSEAEELLRSADSSAKQNPSILAWVALRFWGSEYGIFSAFDGMAARDAYRVGALQELLQAGTGTLSTGAPQLQNLDVLASKLPQTAVERPDTKALLLTFKAKTGHENRVEQFLRNARAIVDEEPATTAWFAIHLEDDHYGIFDVFPDDAGRFKHLTGGVARELAAQALELLGSFPEPALPSVVLEQLGLSSDVG